MKKFENRITLFNEILSEIYKFHLNYKEELNKLNINIKHIITQHSNRLQTGVAKRTLSKYSSEDPFSDMLISDSVQQLLNYYLNKHTLITEEAEEIKNLISQEHNYSNSENLKILKEEEQKISIDLLNLNKAKNKYYTLMSKLEDQLAKIEENKKRIIQNKNNKNANNNVPKTKKEIKEEKKEEKK